MSVMEKTMNGGRIMQAGLVRIYIYIYNSYVCERF